MFIVLTGNPNSGKTQIINLLKDNGYDVFEVDQFVKQLYEVNNIGYILISTHFGKDFLKKDKVDTKKLAQLVLNDNYELYRLKILIWPLIKSKLHWLKKRYKNMVVEMAIFKNDPLYFNGIFDLSIELTRNDEYKEQNEKQKFNKWYNLHTCFFPDYIVENNTDILCAYNDVLNIIKKFYE